MLRLEFLFRPGTTVFSLVTLILVSRMDGSGMGFESCASAALADVEVNGVALAGDKRLGKSGCLLPLPPALGSPPGKYEAFMGTGGTLGGTGVGAMSEAGTGLIILN